MLIFTTRLERIFEKIFAEKQALVEEAEPRGKWEYRWLDDDGGLELIESIMGDGAYDLPLLEDKKVREKYGEFN